jgi:hypothetical protein
MRFKSRSALFPDPGLTPDPNMKKSTRDIIKFDSFCLHIFFLGFHVYDMSSEAEPPTPAPGDYRGSQVTITRTHHLLVSHGTHLTNFWLRKVKENLFFMVVKQIFTQKKEEILNS